MLNWVLGNKSKKKSAGKKPSYEKAKRIAKSGTVKERAELAGRNDLEPELLYYFTKDRSAKVRREVAGNEASPLQADTLLCTDTEETVRMELAHKIGRLVPGLEPGETERLMEMALDVLDALAKDSLPKVRAIIAEELKRSDTAPLEIIRNLAHDVEEIVSAPILEYSPLLSDGDLLDIISGGAGGVALAAIARRRTLPEAVTEAVYITGDTGAVATMLDNANAMITERILDRIADESRQKKEWQTPLVNREDLQLSTIRRIATFVNAALIEALIERYGIKKKFAEDLRLTVRQRIEKETFEDKAAEGASGEDRAKALFSTGALDEDIIRSAAKDDDGTFVLHALKLVSGLPETTVRKIMDSGSGKAVVSLAWKSGLNMETAEALQAGACHVQPSSRIGSQNRSFPLTPENMDWYLDYFS
ncbi:MAG TPA: DUF2336 domain-containing protein [Rhodospirillales bacterium]|nr:DUF2336 domain-containing protein [Rhodospirillales bacterium]